MPKIGMSFCFIDFLPSLEGHPIPKPSFSPILSKAIEPRQGLVVGQSCEDLSITVKNGLGDVFGLCARHTAFSRFEFALSFAEVVVRRQP